MKRLLKSEFLWVFLIFIIAFFLRIFYLDKNLFFGWEQGRDAFIINDILKGIKFTLIGPKTDVSGVFHGPLYYYLMSIPYYLGRGNPLIAAYFMAFLNSLGIFVLYYGLRSKLKSTTRLFLILFYAISFQGIVFSRWLSNPSLVIFFSTILFVYLNKDIKRFNYFLVFVSWGVIFHLEIAAGIFLIPLIAYYSLVNLKKIKLIGVIQISLIILTFLLPFILFDLRHDHLLLSSISNLFNSSKLEKPNLLSFFKDFLFVFNREYSLSVFPSYPLISKALSIISLFSLLYFRDKKIIKISLLWLVSPLLFIIPLKVLPMSQTLIHLQIIFYLMTALIFELLILKFKKTFIVLIIAFPIFFLNFLYFNNRVKGNENFFFRSYQYSFLGDQKMVIDYIYKDSEQNDFYYHYYTFPYWLPQGWEYLFQSYGFNQYKRLPVTQKTKIFYVVIEPDEVTPKYQNDWYKKMDKDSRVLETKKFGKLIAEKREWLAN